MTANLSQYQVQKHCNTQYCCVVIFAFIHHNCVEASTDLSERIDI